MIFYTSSNIYCTTRAATINLFKQQNFGNKKLFTTGSSNKNKMYEKLIKRKQICIQKKMMITHQSMHMWQILARNYAYVGTYSADSMWIMISDICSDTFLNSTPPWFSCWIRIMVSQITCFLRQIHPTLQDFQSKHSFQGFYYHDRIKIIITINKCHVQGQK